MHCLKCIAILFSFGRFIKFSFFMLAYSIFVIKTCLEYIWKAGPTAYCIVNLNSKCKLSFSLVQKDIFHLTHYTKSNLFLTEKSIKLFAVKSSFIYLLTSNLAFTDKTKNFTKTNITSQQLSENRSNQYRNPRKSNKESVLTVIE